MNNWNNLHQLCHLSRPDFKHGMTQNNLFPYFFCNMFLIFFFLNIFWREILLCEIYLYLFIINSFIIYAFIYLFNFFGGIIFTPLWVYFYILFFVIYVCDIHLLFTCIIIYDIHIINIYCKLHVQWGRVEIFGEIHSNA